MTDTITTWRQLADRLTPDQIETFTDLEREMAAGTVAAHDRLTPGQYLVKLALLRVEDNEFDQQFAHIPAPPGATHVEGWEASQDGVGYTRAIEWQMFGEGEEVAVGISGEQRSTDGSYTQQIVIWGPPAAGDPLTIDEARRLAELLDAASDALEDSAYPRPTCRDCETDLRPDSAAGMEDEQWYMVTDEAWSASGMEPDGGYLCIPCLEKRLGRQLGAADLIHIPANAPGMYDDEPYLAGLKRAAWEPCTECRYCITTAHYEATGEIL